MAKNALFGSAYAHCEWIRQPCRCLLSVALFLAAGGVANSQTPRRVDAVNVPVATDPAIAIDERIEAQRLPRGRGPAEFSRLISVSPRSVDEGPVKTADIATAMGEGSDTWRAVFEAEHDQTVPDDDWRKRLELQHEQIIVLERMINLMAEQFQDQGPALEALQGQMAEFELRSLQAAQRDQQLADGLDNLNDHIDSSWRYGPQLPSQLKEWFLPSGTNESPLSVYGLLLQDFSQVNGQAARFSSPVFEPFFLLQLNNRFLLESEVDLAAAGTVAVPQLQMDWTVSDAVTAIVGRYLTPIGFFSQQLSHEWINKLPDAPLMFNQVSPQISTNGLQLRGSQYIFGSPIKLQYAFYGGNSASLGTTPANPPNQQVADLAAITSAPGALSALGGRLALWNPALGINIGMSGYSQGGYTPAAADRFQLYGFDANFNRGNWDARFEFAQNFQQAGSYIGNDIRRTGLYAQLAYRDYKNSNPILANLELVGRYGMVHFSGIDATKLDLTAFAPATAPVDRNQYNIGINYYLYPSMAVRFAYEWNPTRGDIGLNDNTFMSRFVWGF